MALQQVGEAGGRSRPFPSGSGGQGAPLLAVTGISKSFASEKALDDVSLTVEAGEVLAVVGQNGSGKSTLVKVLAGIHQPDPGGTIAVQDAEGRLVGSRGTRHQRLHFIHQDLGLLPMLSTTENLDLGRPLGRRGLLPGNRAQEHQRAADLVGTFGVAIDVRTPVGALSPAERAIVAIARAMDGWTRTDNVLVLDEPTTAFHQDEVQRLFTAVRRVVAQGAGVLFISHRLDEVRALADRVVVLRDGKKVAELKAGQFDEDALVKAITGSTPPVSHRTAKGASTEVALVTEGLRGRNLRQLSFTVRRSEILGLAGVLGSGREELGALLFGAARRTGGTVTLDGEALPAGDMTAAIERGMAFVPADRHRDGAVLVMNMRENLTLPSLGRLRRRLVGLDLKAERAESHRWAVAIGLRPPQPDRPLAQFSGGNQQKVVLAKWLRTRPRVLLLDEPTQGVDVGAKTAIYDLVMQAAADGAAVVVSSSDAKELALICDRVIVLEDGVVATEVTAGALSEEALLRETLGVSANAKESGRGVA